MPKPKASDYSAPEPTERHSYDAEGRRESRRHNEDDDMEQQIKEAGVTAVRIRK